MSGELGPALWPLGFCFCLRASFFLPRALRCALLRGRTADGLGNVKGRSWAKGRALCVARVRGLACCVCARCARCVCCACALCVASVSCASVLRARGARCALCVLRAACV
eukprot:14091080-Alexandrium_andersonii.AAC.1